MKTLGIVVASDRCYNKTREDLSGVKIAEIMESLGYKLVKSIIVPDEKELISWEIVNMCDELNINLVLTTGGTGFAPRDVTPEATAEVIDKYAMGISEAMRAHSLTITPKGMLSRGISGIRGNSLIINFPGSPKAIEQLLSYIMPAVDHGLDILLGMTE